MGGQVSFIYTAQYQKWQIDLQELYSLRSIRHPLSLDPQFG